jgi:hypothetical protein
MNLRIITGVLKEYWKLFTRIHGTTFQKVVTFKSQYKKSISKNQITSRTVNLLARTLGVTSGENGVYTGDQYATHY